MNVCDHKKEDRCNNMHLVGEGFSLRAFMILQLQLSENRKKLTARIGD